MKKYLGVKIIFAIPMSLELYNKTHDRVVPATKGDDGYLVQYEDGYKSWSPKEAFEKAYRSIDGLTFGLAIEAMKMGFKVARRGWNGKDMFIYIQNGSTVKLARHNVLDEIIEKNGSVEICSHIDMKSADGKIVIGWSPSQTDMLAEDYVVIDM